MLENISVIIKSIINIYIHINNIWDDYVKSLNISKINLKKKKVSDIDNIILDNLVFEYHKFLTKHYMEVINMLTEDVAGNRIKSINSISDKIRRYMSSNEKGKSDIIKCLNDIFGMRIYIEDSLQYQIVIDYFKNDLELNIKVTHSNKDDYEAVHIYIKIDNYHFPWELQIWRKSDIKKNEESHFKYKQQYTTWEKEE